MKTTPSVLVVCLTACLVPAASSFSQFGIQTHLDRTAFFVGEPVHYQVRVRHEPGVQFIADRLNENSLRMEPFVVKEASHTDADGLLTLNLRLVTFDTAEKKKWEIPAFNLYYVRGEQAAAAGAAVETLAVPATPIALRSSIPEGALLVRDDISVRSMARPFWIALALGCLGLIAAGVPAVLNAYHWIKRDRSERILDRTERRRAMAARIRELSHYSPDGPGSSVKFYEDLAAALRRYSGEVAGKSGVALTARQVERELLDAGEPAALARELSDLLALADQVRYSAGGTEEGHARLEEVRGRATRLFES